MSDPVTPGDPAVLHRMLSECAAGAAIGYHLNADGTGSGFAVWEPSETLPWIICIQPDDEQFWLQRFPHAQRVWLFTSTANDLIERLEKGEAPE